jgi:hypothetical protein
LATLRLQPSYFKQKFVEAPWKLRRGLGYAGERAPGAGIVQMDLELLYGMSCTVDYPFLRLAEIGSRLGRIPPRLDRIAWKALPAQTQVFEGIRDRWDVLRARALYRLGVYQVYDDHVEKHVRITDGVSYRLRKTAKLRFPIPQYKDIDGFLPKDVPNPFAHEEQGDRESSGLAGGVAWGFESPAILRRVYAAPKSTSGVLVDPYLSALGGWGFQKATFDSGRSSIYANTAMGRVFHYSLERVGRIGVFWNRAKHVIVYERTVAATAQFRQEQDAIRGRPVLRKVAEYVEILEPIRRYPDGPGSPVAPG